VKFQREGESIDGTKWRLYHIETESKERFACFNEGMIETLESALDNRYLVSIEFKRTPKGRQITDVELVG
jgi:hypothetical protein